MLPRRRRKILRLLALLCGGAAAQPAFAWDFTRVNSLPADWTFTRGSAATYRDSTGTRQTAASGVPRFDHSAAGVPLGLLMEGARTNYLLNSTAPATQTTGSLGTGTYTLWCEGSGSAAVAGAGATITGAGTATEGVPVIFVVTVAGTVTVTVTGSLTAFQVENGRNPSSLIITAGTTVARSADVLAGTLPWFNPVEGAMLVEFDMTTLPDYNSFNTTLADFSNGTTTHWTFMRGTQSSGVNGKVNVGLTSSGTSFSGTPTMAANLATGRTYKSAMAWKADDFAGVTDGAALLTDTSGPVSVGINRLRVGCNLSDGDQLYGHVRRFQYFNRRLANGDLQQRTA